MSVCNLFVQDDRILCLTDTLTYRGKVPAGLCDRKCDLAGNGRFAVATRGVSWLCDTFRGSVLNLPTADSAAWLAERTLADHMTDRVLADHGLEITVLGWSDTAGAVQAVRFSRKTEAEPVTRTILGPGLHLAPAFPRLPPLPAVITESMMVRLALAQGKARDVFGVAMCIGGVMHLTTITADGVEQRLVGAYPDYDKHARQFECPNAEAHAAFQASQTRAA